MTARQQLIEALASAWVRGGTPDDDAWRIAEEYVRDPAALAHLGHVLLDNCCDGRRPRHGGPSIMTFGRRP